MCKGQKTFIFSLIAVSSACGLWSCTAQIRQQGQWLNCLPAEVKPDDVVSAVLISTGPAGEVVKKVTVQEKLRELDASCREGKLVDGASREIYFYRLTGCWGMPPPDHEEILQRQTEELETLRKQYTVIEMTCNPSGMPRQ
jgi:hypothetical protein